jgi:hypothetical protein
MLVGERPSPQYLDEQKYGADHPAKESDRRYNGPSQHSEAVYQYRAFIKTEGVAGVYKISITALCRAAREEREM